MPTSEYYPDVVVAAVDILGLGVLIQKPDQCEGAFGAANWLATNCLFSKAYDTPTGESGGFPLYESEVYFGDSAYLFGDPTELVQEQGSRLAAKCAALLWPGLHRHMRKGTGGLLRIGIARGDLRKGHVSQKGRVHEVRVGTAMLRAHDLELAQDWIGGAVAADVPRASPDDYRCAWPVPLKHGSPWAGRCEALDWLRLAVENADNLKWDPESLTAFLLDNAPSEDRARSKWVNTLAFLRSRLAAIGPGQA
jgi:hypothetical protein